MDAKKAPAARMCLWRGKKKNRLLVDKFGVLCKRRYCARFLPPLKEMWRLKCRFWGCSKRNGVTLREARLTHVTRSFFCVCTRAICLMPTPWLRNECKKRNLPPKGKKISSALIRSLFFSDDTRWHINHSPTTRGDTQEFRKTLWEEKQNWLSFAFFLRIACQSGNKKK